MILLNPKGNVNLHTHTAYCDGKDMPEDMVKEAIALGFSALGFSGHGYSVYDTDFCMSKENTIAYRQEVLRLKKKYQKEIHIYLGVEMDYYGEKDEYPYDFVIGSVHGVEKDGQILSVDNTEEVMLSNVDQHFGGDFRAYVERYYETIANVVERTEADIIGHFDLVTKFNEGNKYFDENAAWYKRAALDALKSAAERQPCFEINTGAQARGYRSRPYPADFLLEEIDRLGCPAILSSDCHDKRDLAYGFSQLVQRMKRD
ncbi:histidinol-phosphatase [Ihubacter sp. rT4E-8]|uniref:histidinol-phosphatase n=1 Tax=unclassified Ihubacter TaxID=2633299 RepID=UPI00137ABA58